MVDGILYERVKRALKVARDRIYKAIQQDKIQHGEESRRLTGSKLDLIQKLGTLMAHE